jgi:polyhydroxyalkanoate synthesis regulator phasin
MRDAMAEMAERAQLISQEAGTKITAAMKEVIATAAGIAGFAVESARDLVQYMVRRGQMTQDEADKLIKEAEDAHRKRNPERRSGAAKTPSTERPPTAKSREATREEPKPMASSAKRASGASAAAKPENKTPAKRPAAKKPLKDSTPKKRR